MVHLSLFLVVSAPFTTWFRCPTAVNTFDTFCDEKKHGAVFKGYSTHEAKHSSSLDKGAARSQALTIACKSLSFLKPLFVVILAVF